MSDDSEDSPQGSKKAVDPRDQDFRTPTASAAETKFTVSPELRIANALEYSAYQLGQINKKLDKLIAAVSPQVK
jgi:hypothetical protein